MKSYLNIFFLCICLTINGQTNDDVLAIADSMPKFPGGSVGIATHLQQNLTVPPEVRETRTSAKAYIKFVVDTNGKVINPIVAKTSGVKEFDQEARRVVSTMPVWIPGLDKNKKVMVYMTIPVSWKDVGTIEPPPEIKNHEKAMAYYYEGHKFDQLEEYKKALAKFDQALALENENKYALYDKAKMHRLLGDKAKACEIWNKMISKNIRKTEAEEAVKENCNAETINVPVNLAEEKEKRDASKKAAENFNLGMIQVNQGRYEAALNSFNKCLEYEPTHSNALYNKALMHLKLDNKIEACKTWNKMIALNEKDLEVKELVKKNCN